MENGRLDQADEQKIRVPKPSRGQCKATLDCTDRVQVVGSRLSVHE